MCLTVIIPMPADSVLTQGNSGPISIIHMEDVQSDRSGQAAGWASPSSKSQTIKRPQGVKSLYKGIIKPLLGHEFLGIQDTKPL